MADIFISYARNDMPIAEAMASALVKHGWSVWWDQRIHIGRSFGKIIEYEIEAARCVVVLWSRSSIDSEWVINEAAEGARRQVLVPICIDDVRPPLEFRRLNTAMIRRDSHIETHAEFDRCIDSIRQLVGSRHHLRSEAHNVAVIKPPTMSTSTPGSRLAERVAGTRRPDGDSADDVRVIKYQLSRASVLIILPVVLLLVFSAWRGRQAKRSNSLNTPAAGISRSDDITSATDRAPGHMTRAQIGDSTKNGYAKGDAELLTNGLPKVGIPKSDSAADLRDLEQFYARRTGRGIFTIQFQLLCGRDHVRKVLAASPSIWFLPQVIGGRQCYRMLWGEFTSREEATAALAAVPATLQDPNTSVKYIQ